MGTSNQSTEKKLDSLTAAIEAAEKIRQDALHSGPALSLRQIAEGEHKLAAVSTESFEPTDIQVSASRAAASGLL